jgi:hypothetical protein
MFFAASDNIYVYSSYRTEIYLYLHYNEKWVNNIYKSSSYLFWKPY